MWQKYLYILIKKIIGKRKKYYHRSYSAGAYTGFILVKHGGDLFCRRIVGLQWISVYLVFTHFLGQTPKKPDDVGEKTL